MFKAKYIATSHGARAKSVGKAFFQQITFRAGDQKEGNAQ